MSVTSTIAWNEFSEYVLNFIQSKIRNKTDSEDLLQEVFVKIHLHISELKEEEKLQSWIFNITRNTINDYWKRNKHLIPSELTPSDAYEREEENWTLQFEKCLSHMIGDLPEKYREPMIRSELNGEKQKAVAEELQLSYSATKSRIQRGRELLKQSFKACCNVEINANGQVVSGDTEMSHCKRC